MTAALWTPGLDRVVIGVDPGETCGLVLIGSVEPLAVQCNAAAAATMLAALLDRIGPTRVPVVVAIEKFVVRRRAGASSTATAGETTRRLVEQLELTATTVRRRTQEVRVVRRSASEVKPWATDTRLEAAGLTKACTGMRHSRDAARHALFAVVKDLGAPDPLSRKAVHA